MLLDDKAVRSTAQLEVRTQEVRETWPYMSPDRYVAVQIVAAGVQPLKVLREDTAEKRGIKLVYCGALRERPARVVSPRAEHP